LRADILGARFNFHSNSTQLMQLVDKAIAQLPAHRFSKSTPEFSVKLLLSGTPPSSRLPGRRKAPPPVIPIAGGALLCGTMQDANFAMVHPNGHEALLHVSAATLCFPYHIRYELIEFALYTLAARAQGLVALHGACVGDDGRGVLLLGESGAGKSTLSLHCLLRGLEFLAEDSVLIEPSSMLATGLATYLHIRTDSETHFANVPGLSAILRASEVIERRSGAKKFEIDLRRPRFRLAQRPMTLVGLLFLSARRARGAQLLRPLDRRELRAELLASQRYAASQPGWAPFLSRVLQLPAFELKRGADVSTSVEALRQLLPGNNHLRRSRQ
jgi:hypothetical protein